MHRPAHEPHLIRLWLICLSLIVVFGEIRSLAIKQQATLTEWTIPVTPMHLTTVSARHVYFNTQERKLAELDIVRDVLRLWSTPPGNLTGHSVARLGDSVIFGELGGTRRIGLLNPKTGVLREWTLPGPPGATASHLVGLGSHVYFTSGGLRNRISRLDVHVGLLTEWPIPTPGASPNGIDVLGTHIVFAEFGTNKIGLLDPATNQILEWPVPPGSGADHVGTADGVVYFTQEAASDKVGRLDPITDVITEWPVPTAGASADGIDVLRPGLFVFTEFGGNKIARLDTTAEIGVDTIVVPDVTVVAPIVTLLVPADRVLIPEEIKVQPVRTLVSGTATGGFLEWLLPTPNSAPLGIQRVSDGVVFCETGSNRIGWLR